MPTAVYISVVTIIGGAATALMVLALIATNPAAIGPIGVTGWFILFFMAMAAWLSLAFNWASSRLAHSSGSAKRLTASIRRGVLISGVATIWIGLSSLRQLSMRDIILTVVIALLAELYFRGKS